VDHSQSESGPPGTRHDVISCTHHPVPHFQRHTAIQADHMHSSRAANKVACLQSASMIFIIRIIVTSTTIRVTPPQAAAGKVSGE
jgi:hypothetical protein